MAKQFDSVLIVACSEADKRAAIERAKNDGTTLSAIVRETVLGVRNGEIKPLIRFVIERPLEAGEYAIIGIPQVKEN